MANDVKIMVETDSGFEQQLPQEAVIHFGGMDYGIDPAFGVWEWLEEQGQSNVSQYGWRIVYSKDD